MTTIADRYRRRADAFERKVAAVPPDGWSGPSPCAAWSARDVVDHIIAMHGSMLRPLGRGLSQAPSVADDPLAAFRAARADVEVVLDDPDLAGRDCETPTGPMTAEQHIDRVVSDDLVLHGWDLAKATGQDDTMDPEDVERLWSSMAAIPPELMEKLRTPDAFGPGIEVFGPEVEVATDARPQHRLLGAMGRDPGWSPPSGSDSGVSGP